MGLLSDTKSDSLYPDTHCEQQYFCHAESDLSRCRYNQGCDGYDSLLSIIAVAVYGWFVGCFLRIKQVTVPGTWRKDE